MSAPFTDLRPVCPILAAALGRDVAGVGECFRADQLDLLPGTLSTPEVERERTLALVDTAVRGILPELLRTAQQSAHAVALDTLPPLTEGTALQMQTVLRCVSDAASVHVMALPDPSPVLRAASEGCGLLEEALAEICSPTGANRIAVDRAACLVSRVWGLHRGFSARALWLSAVLRARGLWPLTTSEAVRVTEHGALSDADLLSIVNIDAECGVDDHVAQLVTEVKRLRLEIQRQDHHVPWQYGTPALEQRYNAVEEALEAVPVDRNRVLQAIEAFRSTLPENAMMEQECERLHFELVAKLSPAREGHDGLVQDTLFYAREALESAVQNGYRTGCLTEAVRNLEGALRCVYDDDAARGGPP